MTDANNANNANSGDAFEALRRPDAPIAPSAAFAKRLRSQLSEALRPLLAATNHIVPTTPEITMTVTPYLAIRGAAAALDFYREAFGAVEINRLLGDDGRIGHAEIMIGSSKLMLADEYPEVDALGPQTRGGPTCSFNLEVTDVDTAFATAVALGAVVLSPPADQFHGSRSATVNDPFGHRWTLSALIEHLTDDEYAARAREDRGHGSFTLQQSNDTAEPATDQQVKHHDLA